MWIRHSFKTWTSTEHVLCLVSLNSLEKMSLCFVHEKPSPHVVNERDQHCLAREKQSHILWSLHAGVLSEVQPVAWQILPSLKWQLGTRSSGSLFSVLFPYWGWGQGVGLSSIERVFESLSFHGEPVNHSFCWYRPGGAQEFSRLVAKVSRSQLGWCMCLWKKEKKCLCFLYSWHDNLSPKRKDTCFLSHAE